MPDPTNPLLSKLASQVARRERFIQNASPSLDRFLNQCPLYPCDPLRHFVEMQDFPHTIARLRSIQVLVEEALRIADEGTPLAIGVKLSEARDRVLAALDDARQLPLDKASVFPRAGETRR